MEAISKTSKTKGAGEGGGEVRRVHIIYFLSRMGRIEHPHLIRVHHLNRNGVYLRDIKRWLGDLRGKDMAESFAWSYKRRYKNGYVWQDLLDDDLITPISDNEYVLKGSEILPPSTPLAASPYFEKKPSSLNINIDNNDHDDAEEVGDEGKDHHQYHHKQRALAGHPPPPPKSDNSSGSPPPSTKTTSPSEICHHQQSPVFGSELSTLTDDSIKQDQQHPISKLRTFCQDQQEEEEEEEEEDVADKIEQQQMNKSASSSSSFYSSLLLGKKKKTTWRKEKQDKVNNKEFSGSGGSEEYSSDAILFTNNSTALAATGDDDHKYYKKKMHNHLSSSSLSWSSSTSTSVPSQSPFAKSKSYSSATSKMLRNFIKCGAVDTNDSALVASINSNIHENKSTATTTSAAAAAATMSLNNNDNNNKMEISSTKQKICKREIVGGSTRVFDTPWNQQPQQQSSTTATATAIAAAATTSNPTTRKSFEGVKCSKNKQQQQQQQQSGRKVVSAAYKPLGAPICSQCGKSFKPEKLHTHMKSCRGLKAIAKAAASSSFSASSSVPVEKKHSSHKSEGEGSYREESTRGYFLSN